MSAHGLVRMEREGDLALVTLMRPGRRNALTPAMLESLAAHLHSIEDAGAIVLQGEGEAFCSGFDLDLCRESPDGSALRALLSRLAEACQAVMDSHAPVVAIAHGAAIAGGCALAASADLLVTHDEARLGYPVVTLGISPGVSAPALQHHGGHGLARRMLLLPSLVNGRESLRLGLADACETDASAARTRAFDLARLLASKPRAGVRATRAWLGRISGANWTASLGASLALTGSDEERSLLPRAWTRDAAPPGARRGGRAE